MQIRKISKEAVNALPLLKYEGKNWMINDLQSAKKACAKLSKETLLGFDTETKPAFKKGQYYHVALVQLATKDMVYLFRLNKIGLPDELAEIFENPEIIIAGIGIRDDLKDLQRLNQFQPAGFEDLNEMATQLSFENIGAKNLTGMFMNRRISKSQQVSNWENKHLTPAQISYAATDAWICIEIYEKMKAMEQV